jgi:hypothetical protein
LPFKKGQQKALSFACIANLRPWASRQEILLHT